MLSIWVKIACLVAYINNKNTPSMPYSFKFLINSLSHKEKTYTYASIYIANHSIFLAKKLRF